MLATVSKKNNSNHQDIQLCIKGAILEQELKDFNHLIGIDTILVSSPPYSLFVKSAFTFEDSIIYKNFEPFKVCSIEVPPLYVYSEKEDLEPSRYIKITSLKHQAKLQVVDKSHDLNCKNDHIILPETATFERLIEDPICNSGGIFLISKRLVKLGYLESPMREVNKEFEQAIIQLNTELYATPQCKISRKLLEFLNLKIDLLIDPNIKKINTNS